MDGSDDSPAAGITLFGGGMSERTLANVAKAEEMVEAGRKSEAQAAIQAALQSLDGVPKSEPGARQVRQKLDDLSDRCEKLNTPERTLNTDDDAIAGSAEGLGERIPGAVAKTIKGTHLGAVMDPAFATSIVHFVTGVAVAS